MNNIAWRDILFINVTMNEISLMNNIARLDISCIDAKVLTLRVVLCVYIDNLVINNKIIGLLVYRYKDDNKFNK